MKTAKTCTPNLWQQRSNYVNRQPIKTAKTCTPNRYALPHRWLRLARLSNPYVQDIRFEITFSLYSIFSFGSSVHVIFQ